MQLDFQEVYGIDLATPGLLKARTWAWLALRLVGLLSTESRMQRILRPVEQPKPPGTN